MLMPFEVTAPDLGTAISVATNRAHSSGFTHVSISSTKQTGSTSWTIVMFCENSQGITARR